MNALLSRIYNTQEAVKEASAEAAVAQTPDVDLNKVSAADFLDALMSEQPEAQVDVTKLSDSDLNKLAASLRETDQKDLLEKMASSGELAYWDMAGRAMAHAYADEIQKLASAPAATPAATSDDKVDFNLAEISAADLLKLIDEGYEFAPNEGDDPAKLASVTQAIKNWGQAAGYVGGEAAKSVGKKVHKAVSDNKTLAAAGTAVGAAGLTGAAMKLRGKKDKE